MDSANSNKQSVMSVIDELKRRNVFRVGVAYVIVAWLIAQVTEIALDSFAAPDWVMKTVLFLLIIGFPLALIFAWAFELTPEGIKLDEDVVRSESVTHRTGRKLDFAIIGLLAVGIVYLVVDNYVLEKSPSKTAEEFTQDATSPEGKIMLAVLPLDNLSGDPEQEYFSDGLTEELITQLGHLPRDRLGVIARTSAMYYKGKDKRIDEIGRELGVDYVLEGSLRRAENRVRITAQLIQVSDQTPLWAESFEREFKDIFTLQSEVAQRITRTLALELMPAEQARLPRSRPVNAAAYDAYLKGRYHETRGDFLRAIEHYEEAIREDPAYALAYAALGHTYAMRMTFGQITVKEGAQKHWEYTRKAAELYPGLAEVEINFADSSFYAEWDWSAGEAGFRRAYESKPSSESVVWHFAGCLKALGRFDEAIGVLERALRLDPYSHQLNSVLVGIFLDSHQYYRAIEQYQKMIEMEPQDAGIQNALGHVFEDLGRFDEAMEAYLKAKSLAGDSADRLQALRDAYRASGIRGYWLKRAEHLTETAATQEVSPAAFASFYANAGDKDQALAWVDKLKEAAQREHVSAYNSALFYTRLGETDLAVASLEKAYELHAPLLAYLKVDRRWDPLRDDPRFQDLVRRMNFPE
jgi:TolB-like protein/Flp pilus assembly protein TadD